MAEKLQLKGKRVLVIGLARTGVATALFCAGHSAIVSATETRREGELGDAPAKLRAAGVALELDGHTEKMFLAQDLIIPSPGVPADDPFLLGDMPQPRLPRQVDHAPADHDPRTRLAVDYVALGAQVAVGFALLVMATQ